MTDRERLIEQLKKKISNEIVIKIVADYLLENGVIVPPVKVGNMVYALWDIPTAEKYIIYCAKVIEINLSKRNCRVTATFKLEPIEFRGRIKEYREDDFGKTVFLTREAAEKALAERGCKNEN